jgi:hypothetical protein
MDWKPVRIAPLITRGSLRYAEENGSRNLSREEGFLRRVAGGPKID